MWVIATVLFVISFALFVRVWLDKTRGIDWRFLILGAVVYGVAGVFARENDYLHDVLSLSPGLLFVISFLITRPILRRRVIPPCVRVKRPVKNKISIIIVFFFAIAIIVYTTLTGSRSLRMIIFDGLIVVSMMILLCLANFEKVEICGNGVWHGVLWPWNEYKSFSLSGNTTDSYELKLQWKQRFFFWNSTRFLMSPGDHEAVQQILEPNLPEQPITIDI